MASANASVITGNASPRARSVGIPTITVIDRAERAGGEQDEPGVDVPARGHRAGERGAERRRTPSARGSPARPSR